MPIPSSSSSRAGRRALPPKELRNPVVAAKSAVADIISVGKVEKVSTEILGVSKLLVPLSSNENIISYLKIIESLELLKIRDVTHIVSRALEEDPAGSWSSLKSSTENDLVVAKKFVEDLNTFLASLETLINALDIKSLKKNFEEKFRDFLTGKLDSSLTSPEARSTLISDIISFPIDNLSSSEIILLLFRELRTRSTIFNGGYGKAAFELASLIGQTRPYDPNLPGNYPWEVISRIAQSNDLSELLLCVHALSNVLNLSAGLSRAKSVQSETGLSVSTIADADKIFDGVKITSVRKINDTTTQVISDNSLYDKKIEQLTHALKIARYDKLDGTKVIPGSLSSGENYSSGEQALVRDPIAVGNLTFDELGLYNEQLESSISQLQKVTESLVGFLDIQNGLTPSAVFKRILEGFIDALALADQNSINKYQLISLQAAASDEPTAKDRNGNEISKDEFRQYILRCLGSIEYNRIKSNIPTGTGSESFSTTTTTTKTSENSEVIKDDATVKTVQSTVRSTAYNGESGSISTRSIARAASDNSGVDEKADNFTKVAISKRGNVRSIGGYNKETPALVSSYDYPDQFGVDVADHPYSYYRESWEAENTIFSLMVDIYEDLVEKCKSSIPDGYTITGADGYTVYGKMDEYSIMSLIVKSFSSICAAIFPINLGLLVEKTSEGGYWHAKFKFNFGGSVLSSAISNIRSIISSNASDSPVNSVSLDFNETRKYVETYQNVYAFLDSYSKNLKDCRKLVITNFAEIANDLSFSSDESRLIALSEITPHGIAVRRALLRKWEPIKDAGYLPRVFTEVSPVMSYLRDLRASSIPNCIAAEAYNSLQNMRVLHIGIPKMTVTGQATDRSDFIKITVNKIDYRYHEPDTFKEKEYVFDPALFMGSLGVRADDSSTEYYIFDRNGSSGPYSYVDALSRYRQLNPDINEEILKQLLLNAYNSSIIEKYHYYTSGMILDESTSIGGDASVSATGLNAMRALADLKLTDVVLPPGVLISNAFSDGYIDFGETISGLSTAKKEILSNLSSSYLVRNSKLLDRIARSFDHDRVFLIPIDPDTFASEILGFARTTTSTTYGLSYPEDYYTIDGDQFGGNQFLKNQNPNNRGMSICSFNASIQDYRLNTREVFESNNAFSGTTADAVNAAIEGTSRSRRSNQIVQGLRERAAAAESAKEAVDSEIVQGLIERATASEEAAKEAAEREISNALAPARRRQAAQQALRDQASGDTSRNALSSKNFNPMRRRF